MKTCKKYGNAESLLLDLGVTDPSEINLEAIALYCGVKVKYRELTGCEANILGTTEKAIITVNSQSRLERQRFSIGHELGHWMLDRNRVGNGINCQGKDIGAQWSFRTDPEAKANAYAADLLMPRYLFGPIAKDRPMTLDSASDVATLFTTSLTATAIRFVMLGSFPAMVVCYHQKRRKWFVRGPEVPDSFYPHEELHYETEAFGILFGNKSRKCAPTESPADIWITKYGSEYYDVVEQTVKVSEDEVISIIWWKDEKQIIDHME